MAFPPIPPFGPSMVSSLFAKRMSFPENEHDIFTIINQFQMIFDHLPMKVVLTEVIDQATFHYVPINSFTQSFDPLDIEGKILQELFPEPALERVYGLYRSCLSSQSMLEAELELLDAQGKHTQWILCVVVPLFNDQMTVTHMMLIVYDITLRKQKELAEQREKLALLEQLAEDLLVRSVPVLTVNTQTVLFPLIGSFDPAREALIAKRLREFVANEAIRHILIDLTGLVASEAQVQKMLAQLCEFAQGHAVTLIISGTKATMPYLSQISYNPERVQLSDSLHAALRLLQQQGV